jgi:hypothetical protein
MFACASEPVLLRHAKTSQIPALYARTKGDSMPAFALTALRHWKLIGMGLLCLAIAVLLVINGHLRNKVERRDIRINELVGELKRISDARNEQGKRTSENIRKAEDARRKVEDIARRIEAAPLPGNCVTPDLDTLRNEL